jgi:hypothetical protein
MFVEKEQATPRQLWQTMADIKLDDILVEVALRLSGHRNADEMVTQALTEYVDRLQHRDLMSFFTDPPAFPARDTIRPSGD